MFVKTENKQKEAGDGPFFKKTQDFESFVLLRRAVIIKVNEYLSKAKMLSFVCSVTRLGDFLHFGQPFKAFGNNKFAQISYILRQFL